MQTGPGTWPNAVVFDLDGTVADSQEGILRSLRETLDAFGRREDDEVLRGLIGPPLDESFRELGFAKAQLPAVTAYYRDVYDRVGVALARPYDGIPEVLDHLRERGVRLALATAKRIDFAERMLRDLGLRDHFEDVAGAPLDNSMTPKAQIVAAVRSVFADARSPAWMVGDRHHDVEAALIHGLVPVGALWGYGSRAELAGAGARWLVARPADLLTPIDAGDGPRGETTA
ncbi:MAG: HAD hydrolase-like protein [Acidimicrobiales bacterium]